MRLNWLILALLIGPLVGCAELRTLRERNAQQEQTLAQLRKENAEFQAAYYKIKETLDNELSKSGEESDRLRRELDSATNLKSAKEKDLEDQLRTRTLELQATTNEAAEQKKQAEAKIADLQKNIDALVTEREATNKQKAELEAQLNTERQRTAELGNQLAAAQADAKTKGDRIAALETALGQAGQKLKETEAARDTAESQGKDLQGQLANLQKELDGAKAKAAEADKLEQERAELGKQVETLKGEASHAAEQARKGGSLENDEQLKQLSAALKDKLPAGAQTRLGKRGLRIIVPSDGLFDPDSVTLHGDAGQKLAPVVATLKTVADRLVTVEGHTDNQPIKDLPYADNWGLGAARADRVRELLLREGVNGGNLSSASRGEASPLAGNDNPEGRAKNRRIEIIIGAQKGE